MIKFYGKGPYFFLSNFYPAAIQVGSDSYPTSEHYYQAMKTLDPEMRRQIQNASTPRMSKIFGSSCRLRADWEDIVGTASLHDIFKDDFGIVVESVKDHIMYSGLVCKFSQHKDLRDLLIGTGTQTLVENAPKDFYWGCGSTGAGKNKLGRMLMLIRSVAPNRITIG